MYLQSLEMAGFKSFAPKTTLHFNQGVTAIVGPNGCGKSNVLDALRWVLGEQSAKALRGGEMADVIFSGTDSRQPLGMAEVSMTFTDCEKDLGVEWSEVRITRRVFRDGRSEYLLNKAPCRLRDIHQLFMDTGIGRSAYSIMEQGKIDAILSSRPEDRRAIFEEAAGITKYKAQKKEALRKLEYTEANLLRVTDIIKEVKRQIGSLQRQAGKARRYQALMEDLRTFDTHLSHRNYTALQAELGQVRAEHAGSESAREERVRESESRESELGEFRARLAELESQAAEVRDNIQTQRNRIYSAENRIASNAERGGDARAMIERSRGEIAAGEEKLREQESQIARTDELIAGMLDLLRTGEEQVHGASERVRTAREERIAVERTANQLTAEVQQLESQLNTLRGSISSAAGRREAAEARLAMLKSEEASARGACDDASERSAQAGIRLEAAAASGESAQAALDEAQHESDEAQRGRQQIEVEINAANRSLAEHESRLDVLRQLNESGEGFGEGAQAVLRGLDNPEFFKPAVAGALASFIDVDPRHVAAIEAALGANLQAILFKDAGVAEAAIATLTSKKLGRASVIPRDWIREAEAPGSLPAPEGSIGWAVDFVRASDEAAALIRQLLDGVVLVENFDRACQLKARHRQWAVVTLGGEFITREGIAHGGQAGETPASALMRKNQITDLERETAAWRNSVAQCGARRDLAMETLDVAHDRLRAAREALQAAQVEHSTAQSEVAMLRRQHEEAERRRANFEREAAQLEDTVAGAIAKESELEVQIAACEQGVQTARARQGELHAQIEAARERERVAGDEFNELRVRVATERQQQENLTRQRGPMAARVAELTELLGQRGRDIGDHETKIRSLEAESAGMRTSIENWQMILESGEAEAERLLAQRAEVQEGAEAVESALAGLRRQLAEIQESRGRFEVRMTQLEMRIEHVCEHVSQRFQISLPEFQPDSYGLAKALRERQKKDGVEETANVAEGIAWGRIEELVAELTGNIDSMGPVNLDAIQEYDELEERHTFLEQQNTDLVNSKAELLEVISRINRTTRELFAGTFEKIRVNFQEMFTELFGGGKANLLLVDENDPLESGIEIIAKPPGKQLQSISLLSGGEKTMTAVALLFSIYMVKPSPFCVLDEMDAPLDESNINRFIKILDRFVDQSQFVVITHNKRTIARADMVFGVTMEEHGVSKLVSVKFSGRADTPADETNGHPRSIAAAFGKHGNLHSEQKEVALAT